MTLHEFNKLPHIEQEKIIFDKAVYRHSYDTPAHVVLCFNVDNLCLEAYYKHGSDEIEYIKAVPVFNTALTSAKDQSNIRNR